MGRSVVAALNQIIVDLADAGTGTEPLAVSAGGGLGTALLPLIALAGSLTAAVAVGSLIVAWLRKPEEGITYASTDPKTAGLLPVAFVSGIASTRWLPATVMQLAGDGVIAIHDRRGVGDGEDGPSARSPSRVTPRTAPCERCSRPGSLVVRTRPCVVRASTSTAS